MNVITIANTSGILRELLSQEKEHDFNWRAGQKSVLVRPIQKLKP